MVWNFGGGTLQGTVTVSAPFSIVSGGNFSLASGQPQQVVIRFTPTTSGTFSQNITITGNGGNTTVAVSAQAITYEEYLQAAIQAYNTIAQNGVYTGLATWDKQSNRGLLVSGVPRLTRESLQQIEAQADTALDQPPLDPHIEGFFEEMSHVESAAQLNSWLSSLGEAIAQERFDAEYQRLLNEGLQYVERAFMTLLDSSSPDSAKQLIYKLALHGFRATELLLNQEYPSDYLRKVRQLINNYLWPREMLWFLVNLLTDSEIAEKICRSLVGEVVCKRIAFAEWIINKLIQALEQLGILECRNTTSSQCLAHFMELITTATLQMFERFGQAEATEFARSIYELMKIITKRDHDTFAKDWASIWGVIEWAQQPGNHEQGFSIVVVAARTARLYRNGWVFKGFYTNPGRTWWGAVFRYLPTMFSTPDNIPRGYTVVAGGDHCRDCLEKVDEIITWIQSAVDTVRFLITDPAPVNEFGGSQGIVTFAFTRQGAQVEQVLNLLISVFRNSNIPIIVSWTTSSGQVRYVCIGLVSACTALGDLARQIACAQQNQNIYNCNAQEVNWRSGPWAPVPDPGTVVRITP